MSGYDDDLCLGEVRTVQPPCHGSAYYIEARTQPLFHDNASLHPGTPPARRERQVLDNCSDIRRQRRHRDGHSCWQRNYWSGASKDENGAEGDAGREHRRPGGLEVLPATVASGPGVTRRGTPGAVGDKSDSRGRGSSFRLGSGTCATEMNGRTGLMTTLTRSSGADQLPVPGARPERDAICAQMCPAEDPRERHLPLHQQPLAPPRGHGDLRHHAVIPNDVDDRWHGTGRLDGPVPAARRGGQRTPSWTRGSWTHQLSGPEMSAVLDIRSGRRLWRHTRRWLSLDQAPPAGRSRSQPDADRERGSPRRGSEDDGFIDQSIPAPRRREDRYEPVSFPLRSEQDRTTCRVPTTSRSGRSARRWCPPDRPLAKLFEERIIFLGTPISDDIANAVMAQLLCLETMDPDRDI